MYRGVQWLFLRYTFTMIRIEGVALIVSGMNFCTWEHSFISMVTPHHNSRTITCIQGDDTQMVVIKVFLDNTTL